MDTLYRKKHWDTIYKTKSLQEVSWYQPIPETSLNFLNDFQLPKTAKIIDIGGGDSFLVDHLLDLGYKNISVLDISEAALERAKKRLGERASKVTWIVADASKFNPSEKYDFWHDRAAFHFLTNEQEISAYTKTANKALTPEGFLVIGTFSTEGPKKCSGIEIKQYSEETIKSNFEKYFNNIKCEKTTHQTPFNTVQNFIFCSFKKK